MVQITLLQPGTVPESDLTYVVMGARYRNNWVFVRHRDRHSWEMPAGHIERGEGAEHAARRELYEETGTTRSRLTHLCDYCVESRGKKEYGRLYGALIKKMDAPLQFEIEEVRIDSDFPGELTYPEVQRILLQRSATHFGI